MGTVLNTSKLQTSKSQLNQIGASLEQVVKGERDLDGAVEMYKNALKINHENYFACHGAGVCFLLAEEYPIARAYADARVQKIYAGTNEIMKEIIGRSMGF